MYAHRRLAIAGAVLITGVTALGLAGCGSSSSLSNVWRDPQFTASPVHDVLVVALVGSPTTRRLWEDTFVREIQKRGGNATPSYREYPDQPPTVETLRRRVDASEYDGIIAINRAGTEVRHTRVPGYSAAVEPQHMHDFWGRYGTTYSQIHYPGYVETDRVVRIETTVWSSGAGGRLVWSGVSETIDPASSTDLGREVSKLIVPKLVQARVLA